jgi:hypothetical protein
VVLEEALFELAPELLVLRRRVERLVLVEVDLRARPVRRLRALGRVLFGEPLLPGVEAERVGLEDRSEHVLRKEVLDDQVREWIALERRLRDLLFHPRPDFGHHAMLLPVRTLCLASILPALVLMDRTLH